MATVLAGCGGAPQVVEISPQRGATDVRSNEPIRVRFDRPMDQDSVRTRFHVEPSVSGTLRWVGDSELTFVHEPFAPLTRYQAILDAGYRDAKGVTNTLRHSWSFRTEAPPTLAGASPSSGDRDVDPASYISLTFSRDMDPASLRGAISLAPSAAFTIRQDATDRRRVTLAPDSLLEPRLSYSVTVNREARDVDGNHMESGTVVTFTTGDFRPLRHWIAFIAEPWPPTGSAGDGVWIVNESKFPRRLVGTSVTAFSWSGDGSRLLLRGQTGSWSDQPLDGAARALPMRGEWADYLASGLGYAYLDEGNLRILRPDGKEIAVAAGVRSAAVAPGGSRIAFTISDPSGAGSVIDGYDPDLRTRYRLLNETVPIDGLAWSPDGLSLAYRVLTVDSIRRQIKVLSLKDGGAVTVATGEVSPPAWQADRRHVVFSAVVGSPDGAITKAFRLSVGDVPPKELTAGMGIPAGGQAQVNALSVSADGHQLAFVSGTGRPSTVWLMNADGSGLTPLTEYDPDRFPYSCSAVAWTPT